MKRISWRIIALLLILLLMAGYAAAEGAALHEGWEGMNNSRVFYEIFVGSFSDSNGDGIGDLRGIINRMDYLNDGNPESGKSLGIEGIWLTPIFQSPSYHKYDVMDYYTIDPAFGSLEDLQELIRICHERNVKLILDLALNHTSRQSLWYQRFVNSHIMHNPSGPCYDTYTWIPAGETPPAGRSFMNVPSTDIQVEVNFSGDMPELNYDSQEVRQAALDVGRYWLEMGVDGFRFDAAKYIYLGDHDKNVAFWTWYIGELRKINPDLYSVAEVWDGEGIVNRYIPAMDCFHFATAQAEGLIAETAKGGDVNRYAAALEAYQRTIRDIRPSAMNIPFVSNHDMDRAAGYLTVASGRMAVAASLYILSPGSPFLYYGEEIGLRGSRGGANTDANRRLAMLWGDGDSVRNPVGSTYDKQTPYAVTDLEKMQGSLLHHYRKLIALRKANPEIARGEVTALRFPDTKAGGYLCEWNGSAVGVFHNTTARPVRLDLRQATERELTEISGWVTADPEDGGAALEEGILTLGPQTAAVLR